MQCSEHNTQIVRRRLNLVVAAAIRAGLIGELERHGGAGV
jgi:hypothetical protein